MAVIAAGPIFNFILAFVFSFVILSWAGIDLPVLAGTSEGMPAQTAGLQEGDVITKLDGRKIHLSREISMYLMYSDRIWCRWNINGTMRALPPGRRDIR